MNQMPMPQEQPDKYRPSQPFENPTDLEQAVYQTAYDAARRKIEGEHLLEMAGQIVDEQDEGLQKAQATNVDLFHKVRNLRTERDQARERAELAVIDPLTEVLNRRGLEEAYTKLVDAAAYRRDNHSDCLLFIDADEFKNVNKVLGHHGGDEALRIIAKSIERAKRAGDIVGRWGGDEFIAILPDMPKEMAGDFAERVREEVARQRGMPVKISVSIGIDTVDRDLTLSEAAILASDAMNEAKANGRDQVVLVTREES